jgi:hypothetical protein
MCRVAPHSDVSPKNLRGNGTNSEIQDSRGTPMVRITDAQEPVICGSKPLHRAGREPSFTRDLARVAPKHARDIPSLTGLRRYP